MSTTERLFSLTVIFVNTQSLSNKIDIFNVTLHNQQPDNLYLNEHWCINDNIESINFNNFKLLCSHYSRRIHSHGGSAIFVKKSLDFHNESF